MNTRTFLKFSFTSLTLLAALGLQPVSDAAEAAKKIHVLLVTGDDVMPAHNWMEVSQAIKETLVAAGKFEVRLCEDAGVLDRRQPGALTSSSTITMPKRRRCQTRRRRTCSSSSRR
jgi:hypothetical protein